MRYNWVIFIFLFSFLFLFSLNINAQIRNKEFNNIVKNKKEEILNLENQLKSFKNEENKILKLYLTILLTKNYQNSLNKFFENPEYLKILDEDTKIKILEKALIKKLKFLKEKQKILKAKKENFLKEIEKMKVNANIQSPTNFYIIDPLSEKVLKPGKYFVKVKTFTYIKSPISGTIKGIVFKSEGISLIIENEKCKVLITGLDDAKVDIGNRVTIKEIIGNIKENKDFSYEILCNKQ